MRGRVTDFDEHRGLGTLEATDGTRYPFHCTAVADASRVIEVGADVEFEVLAGHLGRWEAAAISTTTP